MEIKKMGFALLKCIQCHGFFYTEFYRKTGNLILHIPPTATRICFLPGYMRMGSCHTVFNKPGCYFEKILPDSLLGFVLRSDRWN